jgi:hypothetical protein
MNYLFSRLAPAMALCLPMGAMAQAGSPDPSNSKAVAPQLRYQSAFSDYKPWQDIQPRDWRVVNDTVRDAAATGTGQAAHTATQSPAAAPAPSKPMPGHSGHQMHGGQR